MKVTPPPPEGNPAPVPGRSAWEGLDVIPAELEWIVNTRRVPAGVHCRLLGGETVPAPPDGERVVFVAHFERGFALPASVFFLDFLEYYGLQPHHLPANTVMILSAFAAFCEGFAGIEAFVHAWAKYFQPRKQNAQEPKDKNAPDAGKEKEKDKNQPMTQCGAGTIMSRKGSKFPKIFLLESVKKWQKSFFYVKNLTKEDRINLPPCNNTPPTEMKN
jgi:hypothetical protein